MKWFDDTNQEEPYYELNIKVENGRYLMLIGFSLVFETFDKPLFKFVAY